MVREVLTKKVFMEGLGISEGACHVDTWGKSIKSRRKAISKALRVSLPPGVGGLSGRPVVDE